MLRSLLATSLIINATGQSLTIPSSASGRDGTSAARVAGFTQRQRQQILVAASALSDAIGRQITAITFRRDGSATDTRPGQSVISIWLSHPNVADPLEAAAHFAANRGTDATRVFLGQIQLGASAAPVNPDAVTWTGANVVTIPFSPGFTYLGGTLCIEIEGEPVAGQQSTWWPVDHERDSASGAQTTLGQPCGPTAAATRYTATADTSSLRAGSSLGLSAMAQPFSPGALILGIQALPLPLNLGFLGAPACTLEINSDVLLPTVTGPRPHPGWPGFTHQRLQLGNQAASMGAVMHAQWVHLEGPAITTTNALRLQIASTPMTLPAAVVMSDVTIGAFPEVGKVSPGMVPVFRLTLQ